jgi:hypothetical protein
MERMNKIKTRIVWLLVVVVGVFVAADGAADENPIVGLALTGPEAVAFLQTAEVVSKPEDFDDRAITSPRRMELSDGNRTLRVIFKDENTLHRGIFRYGDGREVPYVKDSFLHEIAAYELAQMLGLEMVPACVERKLFSRKGSLCLWVEDTITEAERKERAIEPPDRALFNQQMYDLRFFQQLIADEDFSNIRNILVDRNFRVYKIDSSMAFHPENALIDELDSPVYSRRLLTALESLDRAQLEERLKPSLINAEMKSLWDRRKRILERAHELIAEHGEDKILY